MVFNIFKKKFSKIYNNNIILRGYKQRIFNNLVYNN